MDEKEPRFERAGNGGAVKVTWHGWECIIPYEHWASVISQVSYYGEEDYGWYRALEFHKKEPQDRTTPFKDKPVPDGF